jgi:TRAP-type C4-dicarboxylate transport system substrate-binding protein
MNMKTNAKSVWMNWIVCSLCSLVFPVVGLAAPITLKLGHTGAPKTIYDVVSYKLAERVAANTRGNLEIKVFGNSQFGDIAQHWGQVKSGAIDIFMTEPVLSLIIEPEPKNFIVTITPYIFENQDHYRKFIQSELFRSMMAKVEAAGNMKLIGYLGDRPPRALTTTNRKVMSPADLKGLKIRTAMLPPAVETWKEWGATPTPVAPAEIYTSLKSGLVEGQENDISYARDAKLYEIQKYFIAIDYIRSGHGAWINQKKWDSLSEDMKRGMVKSAEETAFYINKYSEEVITLAEKEIQEKGMTVLHPDLKPFRESAERAVPRSDGKFWEKGLYDKIRALK